MERPLWTIAASAAGLLAAAATSGAQESAALLDAPVVAFGYYDRITNVLDLDGDGALDAIGSWFTDYPTPAAVVSGRRNDGSGGFPFYPNWNFSLPLPSGTYPVTAIRIGTGDFDLDGDDDFAVSIGPTVRYYLSNGILAPTLWATETAAGDVEDLVAADFDGDGRTDVAAVASTGLEVRTTGPGGPLAPAFPAAVPAGPERLLFAAQVEADGLPDLGVAGVAGGTELWLYPVRGGTAGTPIAFSLPGVSMPMPASGDIDGDGDADVVVFDMTEYTVIRRVGPSAFVLEGPVAGGPATGLADVDGDGDLDGVCCSGGGGPPINAGLSKFEISINEGGVFAPAFSIPSLGATQIAGAVDLDGDGDTDLIAGRCVYYADGAIAGPPKSAAASVAPQDHMTSDCDLDGDPDLLFGLGAGLRNAADGTFVAAAPIAASAPAGTAFAGPGWPGDFDGDGDTDLIVEHRILAGTFLGMRLLRNNGGGGLADGGPAAPAGADMRYVPGAVSSLDPSGALPADADGDGDVDLLVRAFSVTVATMIWWNDGSGFFTPGPQFPYWYAMRVADVDGNALPDLFLHQPTTTYGFGILSVHKNLGSGTFAPPGPTPAIVSLYWGDRIALADFDGDGDSDLCAVEYTSPVLRMNDGAGNYLPAGWLGAGLQGQPRRVFATDLDGDGDLDVVAHPASWTSGGASLVWRGTSTPFAFMPPVTQVLAPSVLADADGDGDLDAIGTEVTRNRRFSGAPAGLRRQYGAGLAGTGGMVPTIGGAGPFRAGLPCETRFRGGLGGSVGVYAFGTQPANLPLVGGTLLASPQVLLVVPLGGTPGIAGEGSAAFPWIAPPALAGFSFYKQFGVLDLGAPQGISLSNGLLVTIGL